VFDTSKKHSIYNKYNEDCYLLMFDIKRFDDSVGMSTRNYPKNYKKFIENYSDLESTQPENKIGSAP
jgi:hypothetical protein